MIRVLTTTTLSFDRWVEDSENAPITFQFESISYHDVAIKMSRRRDATYYLVKAVYPTLLCASLSMGAMVVPTDELYNRFSILLALLLTVYAIQVCAQATHLCLR
jgi:hypothetical protein